jgi:hypothetical protein
MPSTKTFPCLRLDCRWAPDVNRVLFALYTGFQLPLHIAYPHPYPLLSCPLLRLLVWRYWFRLSRNVYGGNRSFASYTKTKTVESVVWCLLTWLDDGDSQQVTGSKYSMLQSWSCRRGWCRGWWSQWWVRTSITDHRSLRQRYGIWGLKPENEG